MGQPLLPQEGHIRPLRKAEAEAALFNDPPGVLIPVVVVAPDSLQAQVLKAVPQQLPDRLRHKTPAPVLPAQGVADLALRPGQPGVVPAGEAGGGARLLQEKTAFGLQRCDIQQDIFGFFRI